MTFAKLAPAHSSQICLYLHFGSKLHWPSALNRAYTSGCQCLQHFPPADPGWRAGNVASSLLQPATCCCVLGAVTAGACGHQFGLPSEDSCVVSNLDITSGCCAHSKVCVVGTPLEAVNLLSCFYYSELTCQKVISLDWVATSAVGQPRREQMALPIRKWI